MFTGLIEALGTIDQLTLGDVGHHLQLNSTLCSHLSSGDSLSVNGVCLTATRIDGDTMYAEVSPETSSVTTIGSLTPGKLVNLERPLRANGLIGGHFVQGHVDAIGTVGSIRKDEDFHWVSISYPVVLRTYLVSRGSIAVDGVSLTIINLDVSQFEIQLVPYTWEHTTFKTYRIGESVNLECDILGKYVVHAMELGRLDKS